MADKAFFRKVLITLALVAAAMAARGLQEAAKIKAALPGIKIIIVTSPPESDYIERARSGNVDSFWYKSPREEEMLAVMDPTMAGERIYPDATTEVRVGELSSRDFTARELEVLRELLTGDSNAEIAGRLGMSEKNVRNYISQMMSKTGLDITGTENGERQGVLRTDETTRSFQSVLELLDIIRSQTGPELAGWTKK